MNPKLLKFLETLQKATEGGAVQPQELIKISDTILGIVKSQGEKLEKSINDVDSDKESKINSLKAEFETAEYNLNKAIKGLKETSTKTLEKKVKELSKEIENVMLSIPEATDLTELENKIEAVRKEIPTIPEIEKVVLDEGEEIVAKINSLNTSEENQIDAKHIKNLPSPKGGGGSTARNLYQLFDVQVIGADAPSDNQVLKYSSSRNAWIPGTVSGGSGTSDGSAGAIQYSDGAGGFVGDVDLTFDTSTNTLGVGLVGLDGRVQVHAVKSDASDGLLIEAANGTDVSVLGVGNTANVTHYGVHQFPTGGVQIGSSVPFVDSAGTLTLQNVDALDSTTESTIEDAIDTLANLTSIQGRTVTLADAGADAILGWDDSANAYENLTQAEVLAVIGDSSDTAKGVVELAIASEVTTGTDTGRAITPNALADSNYGKRVVSILVSDPTGSAITTGDGKACFRVPSVMNGWNLVGVSGSLSTVSSSGLPTFQVRRSRRSNATTRSDADMLSTKLSIDASEFDSVDATTAAAIDTSNDDVNTGDMIYIDIDVAGTGAKGLVAELTFQLP